MSDKKVEINSAFLERLKALDAYEQYVVIELVTALENQEGHSLGVESDERAILCKITIEPGDDTPDYSIEKRH